jgi:hypothetical protein
MTSEMEPAPSGPPNGGASRSHTDRDGYKPAPKKKKYLALMEYSPT